MPTSLQINSSNSILIRRLNIAVMALSLTISTMSAPGICGELASQPIQKVESGAVKKKPAPEDLLIVRLNRGADREKFDDTLKEVNGTYLHTIDGGPEAQFMVIQTEPGQAARVAKKLKSEKAVASVKLNARFTVHNQVGSGQGVTFTPQSAVFGKGGLYATSLAPSDPFFSAQWDAGAMNYAQGRILAKPTNTFVPIYFLDTGMSYFPGESSLFSGQFDFSDPVNPTGAVESMFDSGSHGTATSSVTVSSDNAIGIAGMANFEANHCLVYMLRVTQDGETTFTTNILSALAFILRNQAMKPGPINVSFGHAPPETLNADPDVQLLGYYLYLKGCLVVLAAGNDALEDPSAELFCRRVAATDQTGALAFFSDFGPFTAAAPGVAVPVYTPDGGPGTEVFESGTSFSAPRWCAAIVNIMATTQNYHNRTAPFADLILRSTAQTSSGGLQIPDMQAAMNAVNNPIQSNPLQNPTPQ